MNVLILGTFVNGSIENYYFNGFCKTGINVSKFEINDLYYKKLSKNLLNKIINRVYQKILFDDININLINFIRLKNYDFILVFKGMTLYPETIKKLKSHCILLINYNPDHPTEFYSIGSGNSNILQSLFLYDIILTYSQNIKSKLINNFNINAEVIPFGYNLSKINIESLQFKKSLKFMGAFDMERYKTLSYLTNFDLQIFGDSKWSKINNSKKGFLYFQNKKLYGDDIINETQRSLAIINILRQQNLVENSHNMRTFEVPALGGVLLSNFTDEQASFFEPQKEMLFYRNIDELSSQIKLLLENPKLIGQISRDAYDRSIRSNYSYNHRSIQLINLIKLYI